MMHGTCCTGSNSGSQCYCFFYDLCPLMNLVSGSGWGGRGESGAASIWSYEYTSVSKSV